MAQVVLDLPLQRSGPKTTYHDLFVKVTDGATWKLTAKEDFPNERDIEIFRNKFRGWCSHRNITVVTRVIDGDLFVKAEGLK